MRQRLHGKEKTNFISQHFTTVVADNFQDLLDFLDEARVIDRLGQFDVSEMAGTLAHSLRAGLALELSIDRAEKRVVEAAVTRLRAAFLHRFGVQNVRHAHALDLLGRHEAKLNLLHRLERRARVGEVEVRHFRGRNGFLIEAN